MRKQHASGSTTVVKEPVEIPYTIPVQILFKLHPSVSVRNTLELLTSTGLCYCYYIYIFIIILPNLPYHVTCCSYTRRIIA